jgi:energy-coupling factor transporter ATP-binding protein EcfA2
MFDLKKINLGKDEAEQDERLKEYFLKTESYEKIRNGEKTIVLGRKGSGKSAIFTLLEEEYSNKGDIVIQITPDQYSWGALKDYQEQGILPEQAHTNAWKLTLLSAIVWKLNEEGKINEDSKLKKYYEYMKDSFSPQKDNWFINLVKKVKKMLGGVKTQWLSFEDSSPTPTPLRIIGELQELIIKENCSNQNVRIIIDRLDDSWDASKESKNLLIGLLKANNQINSLLNGNLKSIIFLRSDIYDNLIFDDKDKLRQNEEILRWDNKELKEVITERVRVSLNLENMEEEEIWNTLFSEKLFRSSANVEKYIIDRTFKRPRDIISFVRFCLEVAIRNNHDKIENDDTHLAEEESYSKSKYEDLIIEYQKQIPFIQELLDSFTICVHKMSQKELLQHLEAFFEGRTLKSDPRVMINILFIMGVIGVKKYGRAGIKQRGGISFYYYYDDPSTRPLSHEEYYIHPSLRYYLNIKEKRT